MMLVQLQEMLQFVESVTEKVRKKFIIVVTLLNAVLAEEMEVLLPALPLVLVLRQDVQLIMVKCFHISNMPVVI
jgi:hypothetical protein